MLETYVRVWYDVFMQKQDLMKIKAQSIYSIRKADIILIVGCLLASVFISVFFVLNRSAGKMANISCDGVEVAVIAFGESEFERGEKFYLIRSTRTDVTIEVFDEYPVLPEEENFNLLSVADGEVSIAAADCRDQICVRHRPVSDDGESIICLPHRFVVEISSEAEGSKNNAEATQNQQDRNREDTLDGVVE